MKSKTIKTKNENWINYAVKIQSAIGSLFDPESEFYIDPKELDDDQNLKDFLHALSNATPTNIFNKLTGNEKNLLEFNHIANQLVFEYSKIEK